MTHSLLIEKSAIAVAVISLVVILIRLAITYFKKPEPDEYEVMYKPTKRGNN